MPASQCLAARGECLLTTPGAIGHVCTSRPRPSRGAPSIGSVVARSLFLSRRDSGGYFTIPCRRTLRDRAKACCCVSRVLISDLSL